MTFALLLFGMSKANYVHWSHNHVKSEVDYEKSVENYKEYMYGYLKEINHDVDVYISTNEINENDKIKLLDTYKPVKYNFVKNHSDKVVSRNIKMCDVMKLCMDNNKKYDYVIITRFDLIFKTKFSEANINLNKFNVTTTHVQRTHICDNFYLFPYDYLEPLYDIVNSDHNKMCHHIKTEIENIKGPEYINYIDDRDKKQQFYEIYRPVYFHESDMVMKLKLKQLKKT